MYAASRRWCVLGDFGRAYCSLCSAPPLYGNADPQAMAFNALSQSFIHWGFLAWAILGGLSSIIDGHLHCDKAFLLDTSYSALPSACGDKAINSWIGNVVDAWHCGSSCGYYRSYWFPWPTNQLRSERTVWHFRQLCISKCCYRVCYRNVHAVCIKWQARGIQLVSRYNIILSVC